MLRVELGAPTHNNLHLIWFLVPDPVGRSLLSGPLESCEETQRILAQRSQTGADAEVQLRNEATALHAEVETPENKPAALFARPFLVACAVLAALTVAVLLLFGFRLSGFGGGSRGTVRHLQSQRKARLGEVVDVPSR